MLRLFFAEFFEEMPMKCYRIPYFTIVINFGLLALGLIAASLNQIHQPDRPDLTLIGILFGILFALNAYWLASFRVCITGSNIVFFRWFNGATKLDLEDVITCCRSRKGLPSYFDDDLLLYDSSGSTHKVLGQLEGSPELIQFLEGWITSRQRRESRALHQTE